MEHTRYRTIQPTDTDSPHRILTMEDGIPSITPIGSFVIKGGEQKAIQVAFKSNRSYLIWKNENQIVAENVGETHIHFDRDGNLINEVQKYEIRRCTNLYVYLSDNGLI